ncbi:hypothetical protein J7438_06230 [Thalassotalea sp. G20_0]|uniref:hypothetical protein n=1 Tax=Thalassotalea sp. G20_0 TaxID=2821093 RepID=UPI001ADB5D57|nr:hypothetical protein [Thalassotalea sp. G20_0]MBO9493681.1 hypothetical protein [Thalassotalea sp. G20_0]
MSPEEVLCLQASRQCFNLEKKCCTFRGLQVTRLDVFRSLMLVVEHTSVGAAVGAVAGCVSGGIAGAIAGGMAGAVVGGMAGGATSSVVVHSGNGNTALMRGINGVLGGGIGGGVGFFLEGDLGIEVAAKGAIDGAIFGGLVGSTLGLLTGIKIVKNNFFIRNRVVERSDPVVRLSGTDELDQIQVPSGVTTPIPSESVRSTMIDIANEELSCCQDTRTVE